jgi:hypothetical protein
MSPGGASIYCSPHPAALQIAPAARLGSLPFRILRTEEFHGKEMNTNNCQSLGNLFTLPDLHFDSAVLFIFLRQDESLDSPCLASVGES